MNISKISKIPSLPKISVPTAEKIEILAENPANQEEWGFFIDLETMSHLSRFINQLRRPEVSNPKRRFGDPPAMSQMIVIHEESEEWDEDEYWGKKNTNHRFKIYIWAIAHLKELVFATFIASSVAIYTLFIDN